MTLDTKQFLEELKVAANSGVGWKMHNCYPAEVVFGSDHAVVSWRDDLGNNKMTIKQGSVRGDVLASSSSARSVFHFRHVAEGECVLSRSIRAAKD